MTTNQHTADALTAGHVSVTRSDATATITFGHPRGNSLPSELLRSLAHAVDTLADAREVRVIVLRSEGSGPFCAGASFDELRGIRDAAAGKEFFSGFARVILAMRRAPQCIVTRVHGKAVGGGVGLIAASDYVVAHEEAQLRLSELAVGIGPFVVGPVIERRIGHGHFSAMAIDHDWRSAQWGERVGLYARVEPTIAALDAVIDGSVKRLAAASAPAMAQMKRVFREGTEHWETLLFDRAAMSGALILTPEAQAILEGMARKG